MYPADELAAESLTQGLGGGRWTKQNPIHEAGVDPAQRKGEGYGQNLTTGTCVDSLGAHPMSRDYKNGKKSTTLGKKIEVPCTIGPDGPMTAKTDAFH